MKVLPPGPPKYLLTHPSEVERNYERKVGGGPVVAVLTRNAELDMYECHDGYGVQIEGPVTLAYEQCGRLAVYKDPYSQRQVEIRAAYMTTGRVALAESWDEVPSIAIPAAKPKKTEEVKK